MGPGQSSGSAGSSSGEASPTSIVDINQNELPLFLRQLKSYIQDDKVWQARLFELLNNNTYNQCEVDLFELMCSVIEGSLFAQVDWARNSIFFSDLIVSIMQQTVESLLFVCVCLCMCLACESSVPSARKSPAIAIAITLTVALVVHDAAAALCDQ